MSFSEARRVFDTEFRHWEIPLHEITPVSDGVLLERLELPESDIVLTDRIPMHRGRVLRVGPGKRFDDGSRKPMEVQLGQVVWYQSCDVDNGTHILIQEADILLVES